MKREDLRIAVAYWGANSLDLLELSPSRRDIQIVCCLKGGKSDPDVIKRFGKRARHNDILHAKVIWSPTGAIVGSANISSNGLPEEEYKSSGLIEAGVFIDDRTNLKIIKSWFDDLFDNSKSVELADLEAARVARAAIAWGERAGSKQKRRSLIKAIREGGKKEFSQQKNILYLVLVSFEQGRKERRRRPHANKD